MTEVRLRVELPPDDERRNGIFYILVEDGHVVHTPPAGKFLDGWPIDRVDQWVRKKGGRLE